MTTTKFIPPDKTISAMLQAAEKKALQHYKQRINDCGHNPDESFLSVYDFNRGFEYGIQWALDSLDWLRQYKEYSHYGFRHPLNYEKLFKPTGEIKRGDE